MRVSLATRQRKAGLAKDGETGEKGRTLMQILFEDDYLVACNKPADTPVHRAGNDQRPDLESLLNEQLGRELVLLHRLDADTTGVVLFAKQRSIVPAMAAIFAKQRIRKVYWAVVRGVWQRQWNRVATRIERGGGSRYRNVESGGRAALTMFRLLAANEEKSWIEALPKTGRTHQIRLHCKAQGCVVLGDRLYGKAGPIPMALHARQVDFQHPVGRASVQIVAPLPDYWRNTWLVGLPVPPDLDAVPD